MIKLTPELRHMPAVSAKVTEEKKVRAFSKELQYTLRKLKRNAFGFKVLAEALPSTPSSSSSARHRSLAALYSMQQICGNTFGADSTEAWVSTCNNKFYDPAADPQASHLLTCRGFKAPLNV